MGVGEQWNKSADQIRASITRFALLPDRCQGTECTAASPLAIPPPTSLNTFIANPYLILDARYEKVRENTVIRSRAVFSESLQDSGITDTLTDLAGIAQEGIALSATIQELFQPIEMSAWSDVSSWTLAPFEGIASFRDSNDPLKRFRALENAYSRLKILIGRAQNKRRTLNFQIARLNSQLKNASDDAEVQKLVGSLATAQTALDDIDYVSDSAHRQVEMLHVLNQNRQAQEEVAAEEISRKRNRELARLAAEAEATLPDFNEPNPDLPCGF